MNPNNIFILSYCTGAYDEREHQVVPFPFDGTAEELRSAIGNMLQEFSSKGNRKNGKLSDALALSSHGHILNPALFSDYYLDPIGIDEIDIKTFEQWMLSHKENPDIPYD